MRLSWSDEAKRDRRAFIQFVATDGIVNAIAIDDRIDEAVERLAEFPSSGRPGRLEGTRELVVPRTPCLAVYIVEDGEVTILRLMHGAQQWPPVGDR